MGSIMLRDYSAKIEVRSSKKLLPGDIIILKEGDIVPCDCILLKK
jgi:P-type E1-E2 ATPase